MTTEELLAREEIRHIMAIYNTAGDSLRKDEFASVFAENAELSTGHYNFNGREAIKNGLFSEVSKSRSKQHPVASQPKFVRHNLTTSKITFNNTFTCSVFFGKCTT